MFQIFSAVAGGIKRPSGMWQFLLEKLRFIPDYAWWIIVFTIFMKLVTSPLDFYQKYKMKKNQRIGEMLKPDMEKLEKQYGSDKRTLQQKQFQLQKQNGYSIFSACLPMILSLVIFFTFWQGMQSVTPYNEFKQYVERYDIFAAEYYELTGLPYIEGLDAPEEADRTGRESEFDGMILSWGNAHTANNDWANDRQREAFEQYLLYGNFEDFYQEYRDLNAEKAFWDEIFYSEEVKNDGRILRDRVIAARDGLSLGGNPVESEATVLAAVNTVFRKVYDAYQADENKEIPAVITYSQFADFDEIKDTFVHMEFAENYINSYRFTILEIAEDAASQKVYDEYKNKNSGFLWIKSIWIPDVPWKNAVLSHGSFSSNVGGYMNDTNKGDLDPRIQKIIKTEKTYNNVMGKILEDNEMRHNNGYLLLPILAVGLSILSQLIMSRQQKKGGQPAGAGSMKVIMFIMPVVFGFFALRYTSAFALYMVTNSFMGLVMNLLMTFILNLMNKKYEKAQQGEGGVIKYGRRDPNDKLKK